MSFLSSHRLHWGVHHELSENLSAQIDRMIPVDPQTPAGDLATNVSSDGTQSVQLPPPRDPRLDALGP
ncbi:MAG: hypothetical protein WC205_15010 [Opitutaceae bacterium]